MKKILFFISICAFSFSHWSCECDPDAIVTPEDLENIPFRVDSIRYACSSTIGDWPESLNLYFNKPVDLGSVIPGETIFFHDNVQQVEDSETSNNGRHVIVPICYFHCNGNSVQSTVDLFSSPSENLGIFSTSGEYLDTNLDGNEGGGEINIKVDMICDAMAFQIIDVSADCGIFVDAFVTEMIREIIITFNKPVDESSFSLGETIILIPGIDPNAPNPYFENGSLEYHVPFCYNIITSPDLDHNCDAGTDFMEVLASDLFSQQGQLLDGNLDHTDGGTFSGGDVVDFFCGTFQIDTVYNLTMIEGPNCFSYLIVGFNKPVDHGSVVINDNLIMSAAPAGGLESAGPKQVQILFCENCVLQDVTVDILPSGSFTILSTEFQTLDGDGDGFAGGEGNFVLQLGCL